jgi:hypothetical protein
MVACTTPPNLSFILKRKNRVGRDRAVLYGEKRGGEREE